MIDMTDKPDWQYDELVHSGVDYNDIEQVRVFDENHQRFRNYEEEAGFEIEKTGYSDEMFARYLCVKK